MLKQTLQANAASCLVFGAIFAFAAKTTADYVGNPPVLLLQVLGAGLLVNAVLLGWTSLRTNPDRLSILTFAIGDALWVATTIVLLIAGLWITTTTGIIWSIAIAAFVGTCGVLQWRLAPKSVKSVSPSSA